MMILAAMQNAMSLRQIKVLLLPTVGVNPFNLRALIIVKMPLTLLIVLVLNSIN